MAPGLSLRCSRLHNPFTTVKLMPADAPHFVTSEKYLQIFVELPKLASVTLEDMSPGELFLDAMRRLSSFEDRPLAYQDKNLDCLFTESVYGGLTDEEKAKHDKQMTTEQDYLDSINYEAAFNYSRGLEAGLEQGSESASYGGGPQDEIRRDECRIHRKVHRSVC